MMRIRTRRRMTPGAARAVILAAALAVAAQGAAAQETATREAAVIPLAAADALPAAAVLHALRRDAADGARQGPAPVRTAPLRAAGAHGRLRLSGERAAADFTVTLPQDLSQDLPQDQPPRALRLAYRVGIEALPEQSSLTVIVNGVAATPLRPSAFSDFAAVTLPVEALRPGANHVRVEAVLHHRIYCGPDASYALWAEIDLAASGAVLQRRPSATPDGFAVALAQQTAASRPVEVRVAEDVDPRILRAVTVRLAALSADGGPAARQASLWDPAPSAPSLARVAIVPADRDAVDVVRGGDGALVLRVAVGPDPDGSAAGDGRAGLVAAILAALPAPPALSPAPALAPGAPVALSALGFADAAERGRHALRSLRFALPQDWTPVGSQSATLNLLYGYAASLPQGAQLLVRMNDKVIQTLPLDRGTGGRRPPLSIAFKTRALRPGVNTLAFETFVPGDPADLPCGRREDPLLQIQAASTLDIPASPRFLAPGMAAAIARLDGADVAMAPGADEAALAGGGLAPLLALPPRADGAPIRLRVATADQFDGASLGASLGASSGAALDDLAPDRAQVVAALAPPPAAAAAPTDAAKSGDAAQAPPQQASVFASARRTAAGLASLLEQAAFPGDPPLADWMTGRSARAMLLQPRRDAPDALWLVVAPNADMSLVARAIVEGRRAGAGPAGHVSLLGDDGVWRSWTAPDAAPALAEPLGWANGRAVLGVYASWAPAVFTAGGVGIAWLSAVIAMLFVILTRREGRT